MSNDEHLKNAVEGELRWEPSLLAAHIGVSAEDGIVTLTGHVESFALKAAAEAAALRVRGVKAVVEKIEARLADSSRSTDEEIATRVAERLDGDVTIPPGSIKAEIEQGSVTLIGEVEWQFQREAAAAAVRNVPGLVSLVNAITLKPKLDVGLISDDITHALNRSWFFDPKTIDVSADEGVVTLTGSVKSPHERQLAAATAWKAPGVTDVINQLVIDDKG